MSKNDHHGVKVRNKMVKLPMDMTGGPDLQACVTESATVIATAHTKGIQACERAIAQYEQRYNVVTYDLTYFDAFKIKDDQVYLHVRVTFRCRPNLKLVGV